MQFWNLNKYPAIGLDEMQLGEVSEKLVQFYQKLLFSDEYSSFNIINYVGKNRIFPEPRMQDALTKLDKDKVDKDKVKDLIRPFCGEITLLNFINLLLFDTKEKKLKAEYFPDTVSKELKDFFNEHNKIEEFEKETVYIEFYKYLEHIPFTLREEEKVPRESGYNRDYGDRNLNCVYRYNVLSEETPIKIEKGIELRLTYFNLCRVLSYILKLKDDTLKLEYIQNNLDEHTLKNIIAKFNNPNKQKILDSYKYSTGPEGDIYSINLKNIEILKKNILLGPHSEMNALSRDSTGVSYPSILEGLGTYYDYFNETNDNYYNIPYAMYVSKMKDEDIFKNIRFDLIPYEETIKFLDILKQTENIDIPIDVIYKLTKYWNQYNDGINFCILKYIFDNFTIIGYAKWILSLNFLLEINSSFSITKVKIDKKITMEFLITFLDKFSKISSRNGLSKIVFEKLAYLDFNLFKTNKKYLNIEKIVHVHKINDEKIFDDIFKNMKDKKKIENIHSFLFLYIKFGKIDDAISKIDELLKESITFKEIFKKIINNLYSSKYHLIKSVTEKIQSNLSNLILKYFKLKIEDNIFYLYFDNIILSLLKENILSDFDKKTFAFLLKKVIKKNYTKDSQSTPIQKAEIMVNLKRIISKLLENYIHITKLDDHFKIINLILEKINESEEMKAEYMDNIKNFIKDKLKVEIFIKLKITKKLYNYLLLIKKNIYQLSNLVKTLEINLDDYYYNRGVQYLVEDEENNYILERNEWEEQQRTQLIEQQEQEELEEQRRLLLEAEEQRILRLEENRDNDEFELKYLKYKKKYLKLLDKIQNKK